MPEKHMHTLTLPPPNTTTKLMFDNPNRHRVFGGGGRRPEGVGEVARNVGGIAGVGELPVCWRSYLLLQHTHCSPPTSYCLSLKSDVLSPGVRNHSVVRRFSIL